MVLYLDSWFTELLVALSLIMSAVYIWFSHSCKYWQRKGVAYLKPTFPFGNMYNTIMGLQCLGTNVADLYNQFKGKRFAGTYFFNQPNLLLIDPDLIRHVLVKDFWDFQDRVKNNEDKEPLRKHLLLLSGNKWRRLRTKLTPTFTSGKMKMMFQTMNDCGRLMVEVLDERVDHTEQMEMREISARFATDIIGSTAFGIECDCQRNPDATFRQWGRRVVEPDARSLISAILILNLPKLAAKLNLKTNTSEVSQYFRSMVRDTIDYREKNNVKRSDFMQLMIQLKNQGFVDGATAESDRDNGDTWRLSTDDVAAQAFIFFLAGFETSSSTMSFALHELALHPDVQQRLQSEIDNTLKENGGEVTYDGINSMRYLDKVVSETLRKYPPVPVLFRRCNAKYKIPESDVVLEDGLIVNVPVYGLHHDPEYYPEPERFDPERFSEEEKAKRHPYVYLPFGEGPRNCIGMRFGLLQTKVGITYLLSRFHMEPSEKTVSQLDFVPRSGILSPKGGIQLRLRRRN